MLRQHKQCHDRCEADRIKAVILRDDDWSIASIAEALLISEEGVLQELKDYDISGKLKPEKGGSEGFLSERQSAELPVHPGAQL